jgi:hypothetical protein
VITVALLGLLAVGIVTAMASIVSISDFDARQSQGETVLRSYAQAWSRATYQPCTAGKTTNPYGSASPPGFVAPSGYSASITGATFWNGTSSSPVNFVASCPSGGDAGLQSLQLQVQPPRGPAQTLTIEKRSA